MTHFVLRTSQIPSTTDIILLKPRFSSPQFFQRLEITSKNHRRLYFRYANLTFKGRDPVVPPERSFFKPKLTSSCSEGHVKDQAVSGRCENGSLSLEKSKPRQSASQSSPVLEVEFGGSGGDDGKKTTLGGGGGNDDRSDDDHYFKDSEGNDDSESWLFRRRKLPKKFSNRKSMDAVLKEWQKTMMDLPPEFQNAFKMGFMSSAQLVNLLEMIARPTTIRSITRALPTGIAKSFIDRMLADPAFLYKIILEQYTTIACIIWSEFQDRKKGCKRGWGQALINAITATACNAMVVWLLAPSCLYGNKWQNLPNNVFESNYQHGDMNVLKRAQSFFFKAAQLSSVGFLAGTFQASLSKAISSKNKPDDSKAPVIKQALCYGAFVGVSANIRYQLLCGFDRAVVNCTNHIGVSRFLSTAMRTMNIYVGEKSRQTWMPLKQEDLTDLTDPSGACDTPTFPDSWWPSSKWFVPKAAASRFGLPGLRRGYVSKEDEVPLNLSHMKPQLHGISRN